MFFYENTQTFYWKIKLIARGDTFATSDDFRTAFERNMIADGRQSKADKSVRRKAQWKTLAKRQTAVGYNASICTSRRTLRSLHLSPIKPCSPYPRSRGVFRSISQEETINLHIFGKYLICTPFLLRRVGCRVRGKKRSRLLAVQPLVCWGGWTTLMWRSRFYILFGLPHVVITG